MAENLQGKIAIVTGANSGIGRETAKGLAARGAKVVLVCRSREKGEDALNEIRTASGPDAADLMVLDLSSLEDIRAFAGEFQDKYPRLDILVNNAAVWPDGRYETGDGYELQFAVNHLAPFLMTNLLLDHIKKSAPARIVTVSSGIHPRGEVDFEDLHSKQGSYSSMGVYANTKLMNILFNRVLARRLEGTGVTTNCLHPGVVKTNIFRQVPGFLRFMAGFFMKTPEDGARTSIYLAASPEAANINGEYFENEKIARTSSAARNDDDAEKLWRISAELTGLPG